MATSRTVLQSAQADSKWERALQTLKEDDQKQFDRIKDPLDDHHAVLYSVLSAANERKEECMKKRWRINVNGRTIYVRDILEKLCAWVKKIIVLHLSTHLFDFFLISGALYRTSVTLLSSMIRYMRLYHGLP